MIKYGLFFVFIGLIIIEGVSAHPGSRRNDTRKSSRRLYYDKETSEPKSDGSKDGSLESVVLAIDTGVKKFIASKNKPDIIDSFTKTLVNFVKKTASDPVYRSKGQEYDIRPELVRFKDEKPSVLLEINSESIINGLKDLLKSKKVHKMMDHFTKEAAVVYRSIVKELDKGKNERDEEH